MDSVPGPEYLGATAIIDSDNADVIAEADAERRAGAG